MLAALLLTAATAAVPPLPLKPATGPATDYASDAHWLCLPGRADVCSTPLNTTALNPNGYGKATQSKVAQTSSVDCFYVYPTVSRDPGLNSDLTVNEERGAAATQFARFAGVCRTFAPIYRQMTVGAITAVATGGDVGDAYALAYRDVSAAWHQYLASRNQGRPVILIGHSQGSLMLQQLIAREIEGTASARLVRLAILPGINTLVPVGELVGGTFASTPLCSQAGQTGCVVGYVSYRTNNTPPAGALFGYANAPGMTVGCVNPAAPGSRDWRPLDSFWFANSSQPVPGGPITWSSEGPPPTPYLETTDLVSARCVNDGPRGYLEVRTNADPQDKRTDRIGGEVGALGFFLPGWGMHLSDVPEAQGDLLRLVERVSR